MAPKVVVEQMLSNGKAVADIILDKAEQEATDMIVMEAYSRSRTTEMVFEGVTRTLVKYISISFLISH